MSISSGSETDDAVLMTPTHVRENLLLLSTINWATFFSPPSPNPLPLPGPGARPYPVEPEPEGPPYPPAEL